MKLTFLLLLLGMVMVPPALLTGCIKVKTDPIRVEPIEITMNVNLRIARELDDFFADLDAESALMEVDPAGQP